MSLQATVRNAPDYPPVGEIAIYNTPAGETEMFKIANGMSGLTVISIQEDPTNASFNGQPYLWFELQFPGSISGWVRDEYVLLQGDGTHYGLGELTVPTGAFTLIHGSASLPTDTNPPAPDPDPDPQNEPTSPTSASMDRVVRVALDITATFEGGYSTYQNYDDGIISYGRFQFTLAGGALYKVVKAYTDASSSDVAAQIKHQYLSKIAKKDGTIREDETLKQLLREAAREAEMQNAQNIIAKEKYWDLVIRLSAAPRGVVTPLGQAMMLDMGINHGPYHDYFTEAEKRLGVPERSKMPENGANKHDFIRTAADFRKERMYRLADARGWGGLKVRVDFWVNLIASGDWDLRGDADGKIYPKPKREVNAR